MSKYPAGKSEYAFLLAIFLISAAPRANAQTTEEPGWFPKVLAMEFNDIYQYIPPFTSPYSGPHSFKNGASWRESTQIYDVYLGSQITKELQTYMDIEMTRGTGPGNGKGLGGYSNGDGAHSGAGTDPFVARLYLRYLYPLSTDTAPVDRAMDQLPNKEPLSAFEIRAGKMAVPDLFDKNRYANSSRTQFLNYSFITNVAWDYARDNRGYTYGAAGAFYSPRWQLTFGAYMMTKYANCGEFDNAVTSAYEYDIELATRLHNTGTLVRLLAYYNQARMGNYNDAVAIAQATLTTPDVAADGSPGRTKYGLGFNFEQPLADDGDTGLFGRLGINDGNNESFSYTEADRHISFGAQLSGARWNRNDDRAGAAFALNGLSSQHRNYLAAGGSGFMLGDGTLNYAVELILETYYRFQVGKYLQLTPDFQFVQNPGYNNDRGPAAIFGIRAHLSL